MKLISWNIWGMPFMNPKSYASTIEIIQNLVNDYKKSDELQICSIQECWVLRAGPFNLITSRFIDIYSNIILSLLHLLCLLITSFMWSSTYNPLNYVQFHSDVYIYQDTNVKTCKLMNSGLVMITNQKADDHGFKYFRHNSGFELLASKGFQYIYYEKFQTLIINTHIQHGNNHSLKLNQLKQIKKFIDKYNHCEIFVNGDFNIDVKDIAQDEIAQILNLTKINGLGSTTVYDKSVDHCYTNAKINTIKYSLQKHMNTDHHKLTVKLFD